MDRLGLQQGVATNASKVSTNESSLKESTWTIETHTTQCYAAQICFVFTKTQPNYINNQRHVGHSMPNQPILSSNLTWPSWILLKFVVIVDITEKKIVHVFFKKLNTVKNTGRWTLTKTHQPVMVKRYQIEGIWKTHLGKQMRTV